VGVPVSYSSFEKGRTKADQMEKNWQVWVYNEIDLKVIQKRFAEILHI
jgi:hypothetical protein